MKYTLYIIFSAQLNRHYIGLTIDLENRLFKHRHSIVKTSPASKDWILIYSEDFMHRRTAKRKVIQLRKFEDMQDIELFIRRKLR